MKLASFSAEGRDRIGCEAPDGRLLDVSELLGGRDAPRDMLDLIRAGASVLDRLRAAHSNHPSSSLRTWEPDNVDWQPPVRQPSKIVCLALNNRSLDAVKIKAPTDHPAFFLKPATALAGHRTPIRIRRRYGFTHPEPELAVVIGRPLREVSPGDALNAVFGYSILNDVTCVGMREEDSFSVRYAKPDPATGELVEGVAHTTYPGRYKASDTFAPMGPFIVTRDEVPDPAALHITCRMGQQTVAADHTSNYVWGVADALSHISQTMTLLPGDVVSMGTAVGGDQEDASTPYIPGVTRCNINGFTGEIRVEIEGIGRLVNTVVTTD